MKVNIIGGFDVGCHRFKVEANCLDTLSRGRYGECAHDLSVIRFAPNVNESKLHETIIHEMMEAVNTTYCAEKLEHAEIISLSNGLAQVFKSLGITFVAQKGED